jgi:hypothetical protein
VTAVQADALRAAAGFTGQHAEPEVTAGAGGDGKISLIISDRSGPAAARIHALAAVAACAGAGIPCWSSLTRSMHADGELAGHHLSISTCIHAAEPEGDPS